MAFSHKGDAGSLANLHPAVQELVSVSGEEQLLQRTTQYIRKFTSVEKVVFYLASEGNTGVKLYFGDSATSDERLRDAVNEAFSTEVLVTSPRIQVAQKNGPTISFTVICLPLKTSSRKLGVMSAFGREAEPSEEDIHFLSVIADFVSLGLEKFALEAKAREIAQLERERIALEIHDGIAQSLYHILLDAELCLRFVEGPPEVVRKLKRLKDTARENLRNVRTYMYGLRIDEKLSLQAAIKQCVRDFERAEAIPVRLVLEGTDRVGESRINDTVKTNLYYITHEALNNILKHARATKVDVELEVCKDKILLTIKDNGTGFEPAKILSAQNVSHYGLSGMQSRARMLHGTLNIVSNIGKGSEVAVHIPL